MSQAKRSIADSFADIPDPRRLHGRLHLIGDLFALACAHADEAVPSRAERRVPARGAQPPVWPGCPRIPRVHPSGACRNPLIPLAFWCVAPAIKGDFAFPNERPKSIFRVNRIPGDKLVHPNEKPVELMGQLITCLTRPGE